MNGAEAVADAYRSCEAVTRAQAGNFFYGIRLLPAERRRAMCAIYAFARRVDDIGDGALDRDEKLARLDAQERSLEALGADGAAPTGAAGAADPVVLALADARARFAFPASALSELIEGVRMDVHGATYEASRSSSPTAVAWPERSGAYACRCSACAPTRASTARRRKRSLTISAWRCS